MLSSGAVFFVVFAVLLFLGSLFEKIFGSDLLFLGIGVGCVYSGAVLACVFVLVFGLSFPKMFRENSLLVRSVVWQNFRERTFVFVDLQPVLVTHSWLLLHAFPPSRRGKCCPFFHFCFLCLVRCLSSLFYRSSFLRVAV